MTGAAELPVPARLERRDDGTLALHAPEVGRWRDGPPVGRVLQPGEPLGRIERLGRMHVIAVPEGAAGVVIERWAPTQARPPVGYGTPLVVIDPEAAGALAAEAVAGAEASETTGIALVAPIGGRFYARPGPGKPPFVSVGDVISDGHTVAIVEVMKTFNRVQYGGAGLPSPARVTAILRQDDEDISAGDRLLEVEEA